MSQNIPIRWEEAEEHASRLRLEGRLDEAAAVYRLSLERFPWNVVLLNGLGLVLLDAGRPAEACPVFDSAVRLSPHTPALVFNLGNALRAAGDSLAAIGSYERAISLGLDMPEVYNNLGVSLQECDRWHDALGAFTQALSRNPRYLPALANSGHALIQVGRPEEAVEILRTAISLQPAYADAHWLLSHALLVTGQWPEGWEEYEWRWHRMKAVTYHRGRPESRWKGEDIAGKTILLYAEQGIGDAVQFARYIPLVKARGAKVILECHAELVPLLEGVEGVSAAYARGASEPPHDVACPLLSLPSVLRTTVESIPGNVPYVRPDAERAVHWRELLEPLTGALRVGLVWAGNAGHTNDRRRSLLLEELTPLASVPGVRFVSLQKSAPGDSRCANSNRFPLVDWASELHDFADTAALISELDLVIAVDTAVAHVAGALGIPVWMLVPFSPDWRWLLRRTDSPWYPSMRLFRQPSGGDWCAVVEDVCALLRRFPPSSR